MHQGAGNSSGPVQPLLPAPSPCTGKTDLSAVGMMVPVAGTPSHEATSGDGHCGLNPGVEQSQVSRSQTSGWCGRFNELRHTGSTGALHSSTGVKLAPALGGHVEQHGPAVEG